MWSGNGAAAADGIRAWCERVDGAEDSELLWYHGLDSAAVEGRDLAVTRKVRRFLGVPRPLKTNLFIIGDELRSEGSNGCRGGEEGAGTAERNGFQFQSRTMIDGSSRKHVRRSLIHAQRKP
jgi:hypothetical protein